MLRAKNFEGVLKMFERSPRLSSSAEQQLMDLIHACSRGCDNESAFREIVRRYVSPLIPHRFSVAVLGSLALGKLSMRYVIGTDFPDAHLRSIPHQVSLLERPVIAKWLTSRQPLVIDAQRDGHWLSELEIREIKAFDLGRFAVHGQIDISAAMATYFSFAGVDPAMLEIELLHRLRLIAPHLHAAFVSIPRVNVDQCPSSRLTSIEQEMVVWLASGRSNAEIARIRGRSAATIRNQLHALYVKLGVSCRAEAVAVVSKALR
jgi:DNA-binding CsgD family transcriptional regulator